MSKTLRRLDAADVHIRPDWDDARRKWVSLSPSGRRARDQAAEAIAPVFDDVLARLGQGRLRDALPTSGRSRRAPQRTAGGGSLTIWASRVARRPPAGGRRGALLDAGAHVLDRVRRDQAEAAAASSAMARLSAASTMCEPAARTAAAIAATSAARSAPRAATSRM